MKTRLPRRALIETFESRILYSADPTPTGLAAAALAGIHQHLDAGSDVAQGSGIEIAFIDARLPDVQLLLDDLAAQQRAGKAVEVVLVTAGEDGIAAISATLAGRSDVSAVHVVGHGSDGLVELGSVRLDAGALLQRAGEISAWGDALGANADLLLYGCDVAADENGRSLVDALAQLTGADVAASDDLTGSALLGGDWTLEYTTGSIEATPFASATLQASWAGVLTLSPQGGETLVNTTTSGSQGPIMGTKSVAMDANGNYVVVWQDGSGVDGSGIGIYGQRYNAAGTAQGGQFRVNTYTAGDQQWPEVTMDSSGNFVVVWQSMGQDGSNLGVYARRYNAAGTALDASEFRVAQTTNLDQAAPAIATDSSGNVVVTWVSMNQDAWNTWGIYARRFAANGTALSNEFQVNTYTASDQEVPTIAMDSSGNFVIAWSSNGQDGSTYGIYAQRFDTTGARLGAEFRVNSTTADAQAFPSIAMDTTGFVIVWQSNLQDGSGLGVYGQRYNSAGTALGSEFRINSTVADAQTRVMVASTGAGGFLTTWNSNLQDGSLRGAYMRQYDSSGTALTGEVLVNTTTSGEQLYPSVAVDTKGHAVVVWGGNGVGDSDGMFMQRYTSAYPPVITLSGYSANYVENAAAIYDAAATVADNDTPVFTNGQLLYQITANGTATDELGIRNQGSGAGQIGISGSNVTYGGVIIGSYSGSFGNGSTPLAVTFNSNATVAAVQALVRNITYRDTSENPSTATRTISLTVSDGSGQTSTPAIITMAVTAVNDPPVINSNGGGATASVSVVENTTAVTTITSTDVDGGTATYSLSGSDATKFSINASGALSFISAPNYEAPTDAGLNNVYDVTVQVSDGAGGSDTQAIAVTVTNVNEAPILNTTPAVTLNAQQEDSGAPSGAVGTLVSSLVDYVDGAGWNNVTDEDAGTSLGVAIVATNTTSGSWYYTINGGTNWSALGAVSTTSARLLAADTQTRVYFVPNSNYNGTQSSAITIRAWDRSSGSNGSLADTATSGGSSAFSAATDTVSLTINAVNDEQSITTNTGTSFSEGSTGNVITAAMLTTSDVDNSAAQLTYTLIAIPTNGTLYRNGVALAGSGSFTQADINAGLLTYTHNGSESTGDSFAFSVDDGAGSASSGSFIITINGVNDNAPVITSNGGAASASISVAENTIAVTTVSATDADIPSTTLTYSLSGGVDMNKFSIDASTGVLRFLTAPDFENPADNGGNNVYDLIVQVSDGSLTDTQTIAVTVTNVASELVVTTTADLKDGDTSSIGALVLNKGGDGRISLREAIEAANNTVGADTITFNIADALVGGAHTINLGSLLPDITGTITIDGSTEPDWTTSGGKPVVVINGGGTVQDGLRLYTGSDGSTIRGLVIQNFTEDGIDMSLSGGHRIVGNRIGTSADGTTAAHNNNAINLWASSGNQIGGTGASDGNLLSGNYGPGIYLGNGSNNNVILGNLIGLDVTGTAALGNHWHGVYVIDSSNNQFGGSSAAERNVISGNWSNGLYIGGASSGNVAQGNYIGLDAGGNNAIGNTEAGVMLSAGASGNTIGGATAAERNVISGNTQYGVYLTGASTSGNLIRNNYIGVDAAGTTARSNGGFGVVVDALASNTTIADNLISGNTNTSWSSARGGIYLYADGVTIQGNTIGLGATGAMLGNGGGTGVTGGVLSNSGSINVLIGGTVAGQGNVIAGNTGPGVLVQTTTSATRVLGNSIYANSGLGIDLGTAGVTANDTGDGDSGANALQNYPVIATAFTSGAGQLYVNGSLNSVPSGYYRVEFFASTSPDASGYGEGQRYLGFVNVTTDASGNASIGTTLSASVAVGEYLSATATQSASGYATFSYTSEFSAAVAVADFNDPPVLTPSGAGVAYVENQPAVILDSGILVTDVDSASFAGGTLTVSLVAMGSSSDILGIRNDGTGVGQIGLSGANVTYGGLVIGTRSGGTGGTPLVVSLNAAADVPAVQALTRNLSFISSGDAISDNTRTVRLVLAEGDGTISNNVDVPVLVEAVNDAPIIILPASQSVAEDTTITLGSGTGNPVTIADADALSAPVRMTVSAGNGVITLASTVGLTFQAGDGTEDGMIDIAGTVADINAALDGMFFTPSTSFNGTAWLQIDVSDQGNSGTGGALTASQSLMIEVTPVNDPPTVSFISVNSSYTENAGPVVVAPSATISDVDSVNFDGGRMVVYFSNNGQPEDRIAIRNEGVGAGQVFVNGSSIVIDGMVVGDWAGGIDGSTPLIISFNSNATTAMVQAIARNITYENVSDAPSTAVRTMVGYVEDGDGGTSNVVSGTLTIIPSNDAPTIVSDGGGVSATIFVAENTTNITTVIATDPDSTGLVYSLGGGADETAFSIDSVTGELRFVSPPDYESATDFNGDNVYDVIVQVVDSNGAATTQALFVTVTNTNEAPLATIAQPGYSAYEQTSLVLAGTGMSISDVDAGSAVIRATLGVTSGVLTAAAGGTGVTVTGSGTASLTFEGTQAQINDLLAGSPGSSLSYLIDTDTPPASDTLTLAVDDLGSSGSGSPATGTTAVTISITAVNDGPANSSPGTQVTAVSTALVFSVANGNSFSIADVDAGGAAIRASLAATHGTLTLGSIAGLTFSVGDGTADSTLTFSGSLADINAALEGLTFTPTTAYNGDATITLDTSDQGNTGGGALTDSSLVHVQVGATRYQEGVDGYTGTQDTYVEDNTPTTAYGSATTVLTDDGSPLAQGLLKFDNLFGSAVGQIPFGATINSASLSFYVTNRDAADTISLYRMLSTWSESSTWNTLGTGVQTNGSEAASSAETTFSAGTTGWNTISGLTATVQAWADGAANHGWAFITQNPGADGWTFASSEYGTVSLRPYLVINYTPPAAPVITSNGGGASANVVVNENTTAVTTVTATDADSAPAELSYRITSGDDQAKFTIDATTGVLRFISAPDHEAPSDVGGDNIYKVIVEVSDGFVADTQTIDVTVSNVNEVPSFTSLGGTVTYIEDGTPAVIDGDVSIFDPDLSADNNFDGATLTLTRNGGANTLDRFSASGNLATLAEGGSLLLGGVNVGTVTTNSAGTLSLTFNGNATQLRVNELMNSLAYANASDTPPSSVQINWAFNDGNTGAQGSGGALAASGNSTVNITAANDAPTATNLNAAQSYTEDTALPLTPIVVSDVDSASVTVTLSLSDTAAGSLSVGSSGAVTSTFSGGVWTASGAVADVNTLLASLSFTPSLDYNSPFTIATAVSDGSATLSGSKTMSGVAVNDAPTATNLNAAQSYTEDTTLPITPIVVSDVDSANVTVTLTLSDTAAGSLNTGTSGAVTSTFSSGVWTASGALADVNSLLAGLSFTPSLDYNSAFTIATSVSDGTATLNGSKALTGVAVNDAPTATNLNTAQSYTEDTTLPLTPIVVSDVDSATVTVTLTLSDVAAGSLNTATSGAVTSTFSSGVWTASGALADVNSLLAGLSFTPSLDYNSAFTIATSVSDGTATLNGSKAQTGVAVNDAPTATNLNAAQSYTEDTTLPITPIVVSDVDSANVTVTLTLSDTAAGSLNTGTSGAVTSTFSSGVWTASGALADVNSLLAGLSFTPSLDYNSAFTIATSVSDGTATLNGSKALTGVAVNDAPTATNLNAAQSYTEDTTLPITPIVVSDVDSADVTVTLTLSDTAAGSLNTATSGAVTSTFSGGVWTASGAIADVNNLLASLSFTPALDYNSAFTIATSVSDGTATLNGSKALTGVAINDAPTATNLNATQSYTEDTALPITPIVVSDVDSASVTVTLTLSDTAAGSLNTATSGAITSTFSSGVWTASGALADVNNLLAGLSFTPALDYNSAFTIATAVSDGTATLTGSKALTGVAVNDAPTATNLSAAQNYTEDTTLPITPIVVSDVDSASVTVTLTLSDTAAGSLNTATSGAVTSTFSGGVWTASGALADVNNLLAGLSFTPALDYNSAFTIATAVSDGSITLNGSKALTGVAVNDAPVLDNAGTMTVVPVTEDDTANAGQSIASVIASAGGDRITDVDSAALEGVAIFGTSGALGRWEYSMDGSSWTNVGSVSISSALLLRTSDLIRFVPDGANGSTAGFAFSAWDQSSGVAGTTTDLSARGGNTAFSTTAGTATIGVSAVNDAPVLTVTSPGFSVAEDPGLPSGAVGVLVSDFIGGIGDVDNGAVKGIAIVASNGANGTWYFSIDGGANWNALGSVDATNARLLAADGSTRIHFLPVADFNGSVPAALTIRAWDQSTGTNGGLADTGGNGCATAYSMAVDSIALTVTAVNDTQVITVNTGVSVLEGSSGNLISGAMLTTSDVDNTASQLTYTLTASPTHGILFRDGVALSVGASFSQADINASLVTYTHDGSETTSDGFAFMVDDGIAMASAGNFVIGITPVNDTPPMIDSPSSVSIAENTTPVLTVTATDADLPAQTLIYGIAGGADAGLFSIDSASGVLRFAAAPDYDIPGDADGNNVYDVVVRVSDGSLTGTQRLAISVLNRNEMPQGSDGRIVMAEDGSHVFTVSDFGFADAFDVPANSLAAVQIVGEPFKGVLSLGGQSVTAGQWITAADIAAGLLSYTPPADENGTAYASLVFRVRDDGGRFDGGIDTEAGVHTLVIEVSAVNDAPAGNSESYSLDEDTVLDLPARGVLGNDLDRDGDTLSAALVSGPVHGSLVLTADGSFRYTPSANWSGTDSFSYRPFDGVAYGNTVQVSLVVGAVNDAPEIIQASFQVLGGSSVVLSADMIVASDVDSLPASIQFKVDRVENGHFELDSAAGRAISQFSYADLAAGRVSFAHDILSDLPVISLHADDGQAAGSSVSVKLSFVPTENTGASNPAAVVDVAPSNPPVVKPAPVTPAEPAESTAKPPVPQKPSTPIILGDAGDSLADSGIGRGATNQPNGNDSVRRHDGVDRLVRFGQAQVKLVLGTTPEGPLMSFMLTGMDPAAGMSSSAASRSLDSKAKQSPLDDGTYADVRVVMQSVELTGVALSVGVVWWASRAGGLVASLLMAAPAWRTFDPLPVLGPEDKDDRDWGGDVDDEMARDEEGVADLFGEAREGMHS